MPQPWERRPAGVVRAGPRWAPGGRVRVVVVGAGPAGVATALLLARYGVEVVLVGGGVTPGRLFRGEGLFPLGIDALHEMGVGRVLDEVPSRTIGSWDTWTDGERVLVVAEPVAQLGRRAVRVVSQPALLARLLDRATGYPGFAFRPRARLAELLRDGRRRVVGARLVPTGGGGTGWDERADLVLGCDGRVVGAQARRAGAGAVGRGLRRGLVHRARTAGARVPLRLPALRARRGPPGGRLRLLGRSAAVRGGDAEGAAVGVGHGGVVDRRGARRAGFP